MIALDAFALVAFVADEPAADEVADILRGSWVMSTVNLAESLDVLHRVHGIGEAQLKTYVEPLLADTGAVDTAPAEDAWVVARLRRAHYHRTNRAISVADCFLIAAAARLGASVATADPHVAATARDESIGLVPLPDSSGRRP